MEIWKNNKKYEILQKIIKFPHLYNTALMKGKVFVFSALAIVGTVALASCKKGLPEEPYKTMLVVTKSSIGSGYNNTWFLPSYLLRDKRVLATCGVDTSAIMDEDGDGFPAMSIDVTACSGDITEGDVSISYNISGDFTIEDGDDTSPGGGKVLLNDESTFSIDVGDISLNLTFTPKGDGSGWYDNGSELLVNSGIDYQKSKGSGSVNFNASLDTVKVSFSTSESGSLLTPKSGSINLYLKASVSSVQRSGVDGSHTDGDFTVKVSTEGNATVGSDGRISSGKASIDIDGEATTKSFEDVEGI